MVFHNGLISQEIMARVVSERHKRVLMDASRTDTAYSVFQTALNTQFSHMDGIPIRVLDAWEFAKTIDYTHGDLLARIYMNHPLRVAAMIAQEVAGVSEDTLVVALLHNILEVSKVSIGEIENRFGERVALAIRALTIDRTRQDYDYRNNYYSRIENAPAGCAVVKIADKLDNIYMICFNPLEDTRVSYLNEIEEWVIPLALRVAPHLATHLEEASFVMREVGFLNRDADLEDAIKGSTP